MKISIAMASYNGEEFILEQLESFIKQTRQPDELIITDDCSTDSTLAIIEKFKKKAPFEVKVYSNKKNLGYTRNFNKAMQLCTNELVFLSDQDDVWLPTKIEYMVNLTRQYPHKDLFMIDAELTDTHLNRSGLSKQGQIRDLGLNTRSFVMGCCVAVKKSYLDLILAVPKGYSGHDNWIVNISDILDLKYIDPSVQQYYRIHDKNTSVFSANRLVSAKKTGILAEFSQKIFKRLKPSASRPSKSASFSSRIYQKNCLLTQLIELSKQQCYALLATNEVLRLEKEIKIYEKRLKIVSSDKLLTRLLSASELYINSDYKTFNGLESFISDIFFP